MILPPLPRTATAPFCPSEISGTIPVPAGMGFWRKLLFFCGPALLIAVGYVDPGNWATDIAAGAHYGYDLLFVVLFSSLAAVFLQCLSMRVGIVSRRDLAQLSRDTFGRKTNLFLWLTAEVAIIACDIAEVLGCGLAFHLLLGIPLWAGIVLTALDTILVLGLKGRGFRQLEAIVLGLMLTIGICYGIELYLAGPDWQGVAAGFMPLPLKLSEKDALLLAVGIIGATVMPHNLYLHSSLVSTRRIGVANKDVGEAIKLNTIDTVISLLLAFFVNAAILVLAGTVFHPGHAGVEGIDEAYKLLEPLLGTSAAALLFGIALLAAGQSSTFTGTIAGQIILEGFLDLKIPCWQRRVITRGLALLPALAGILIYGDHAIGGMMVLSQVVLGLQLPFAMFCLIRFAGSKKIMRGFASGAFIKSCAWLIFGAITVCNLWLLFKLL